MFLYLYLNKYNYKLKEDSEFEINISSAMRNQFLSVVGDKEALMKSEDIDFRDLLFLIEKPKSEMKQLLKFSHDRFKKKVEYLQVVKILTDYKKNKDTNATNAKMNVNRTVHRVGTQGLEIIGSFSSPQMTPEPPTPTATITVTPLPANEY